VREAIEAAGAQLRYLPAYSPDLNPIENAYAKIKSDLRTGAALTVDALWRLVGRSVKAIAPSECAGYFRHAGYRSDPNQVESALDCNCAATELEQPSLLARRQARGEP